MNPREMEFELKKLSAESVFEAIQKAQRYRLLNEPGEAESISRDILSVETENHAARILLLLSLTDQFPRGLAGRYDEARELVAGLEDEYEKNYYSGIICERRAKAMYAQGSFGCGYAAYEWLRRAMGWFEKAEETRPEGNDVSILRWNACARKIMNNADIRPDPELDQRPSVQNE